MNVRSGSLLDCKHGLRPYALAVEGPQRPVYGLATPGDKSRRRRRRGGRSQDDVATGAVLLRRWFVRRRAQPLLELEPPLLLPVSPGPVANVSHDVGTNGTHPS